MKIANVTDKPAEYVADSVHRVLLPGEVHEVEDWVGQRAIQQNQLLDSTYTKDDPNVEGQPLGESRIVSLGTIDAEDRKRYAQNVCPWVGTGNCTAAPFKSMADLRAHLDTHLGAPTPIAPTASSGQGPQGAPSFNQKRP